MLCQFSLYNKVNCYMYMYIPCLLNLLPPCHLSGHHRAQGLAPVSCSASHQLAILRIIVYMSMQLFQFVPPTLSFHCCDILWLLNPHSFLEVQSLIDERKLWYLQSMNRILYLFHDLNMFCLFSITPYFRLCVYSRVLFVDTCSPEEYLLPTSRPVYQNLCKFQHMSFSLTAYLSLSFILLHSCILTFHPWNKGMNK